ncbi:MAG: cysteine methyltransferase, partial [Streptomycetaceae bacterium]|nr:cysteine methyltransferase [Streptomycetaceae bacterium]
MRGVSLPTPIAERVLDLVARIPPGRVMAYGDVAASLADSEIPEEPGEPGDP